jgi:flavin prenyltransferase
VPHHMPWPETQREVREVLARAASGEHLTLIKNGLAAVSVRPADSTRRPWVIGISGASGIRYAATVLTSLLDSDESVDLIVSRAARLTILDETGVRHRDAHWRTDLARWLAACEAAPDLDAADLRHWPAGDFAAGPSSGSYPAKGMIVVPASSAAAAGIARGLSKDLLQRAAEVMLKERRRLVIALRETPLTGATLENLLALDRMGAIVLPASPGFYGGASEISHLVDFVAAKILDVIDVPHRLMRRWDGVLGGAMDSSDETGPKSRSINGETPRAGPA